jgi:5,6-dimethylbenzimidazole synthase
MHLVFSFMLLRFGFSSRIRSEQVPLEVDHGTRERRGCMDLFTAIKERRSCRDYSPEPVSEGDLERILEAAVWAPSPLNTQPWEFIVITDGEMKGKIFSEAERCRRWALEKSGWKWLSGYDPGFLKTAPVLVAVVGDPKKSGVDMFMEDGPVGYQHACAAATQNMILAAHALGLATLWFTFFDKKSMREILKVDPGKVPLSIICLGKASRETPRTARKDPSEKTTYVHPT